MKKSKGYRGRRLQGKVRKYLKNLGTIRMPKKFAFTFPNIYALLCLLLCIGFVGFIGWKVFEQKKLAYLSGKNIVYQLGDILGIQTETASVTVDFGNQIATGSPLIFGGAHAPYVSHQEAWDKIKAVGVTSIRRDFYLEYEVPQNISLDDYINNRNNVQDPKNWNWQKINETQDIYKNAKQRGMKVIGIVAYAPKWLTHSGTNFGVPKNWEVYEDIIGKIYEIHRPYLDYVEIWNEPDLKHFLNVENSNLTDSQAYTQIFLHAAKAVQEVDNRLNDGKRVQIGAQLTSSPKNLWILEHFIQDLESRKYLNFISYHNYGHNEPSWDVIKQLLDKYGNKNMPIFMTEWNKDGNEAKANPYNTSELGIPFTGSKFINFLSMGLPVANYFSTTFNDTSRPNTVFSTYGIYRIVKNKTELLPQARTWNLMSNSLALGKGNSVLYSTSSNNITAIGFRNMNNQHGIVFSNENTIPKTIHLKLLNLPMRNRIEAIAYEASQKHDGGKVVGNNTVQMQNEGTFKVVAPPLSVIGILFSPVTSSFIKPINK